MPSTGRIDDLFDLATIDAQQKKVMLLLNQLMDKINELNKTNLKIPVGGDSTGSGSGSGSSTPKKVKDDIDKLEAAYKKLALAESELGAKIAEVNEKTRQQNVVNAQNARLNIAQAGSLNELRARLAAATREFDNMGTAERKFTSAGKDAIDNIKKLQKEVRELEQETGRYQRNVGNYPQQLVGGATGILSNFGVALGTGAIVKQLFDTTLQVDALNTALKNVSGTQEEYSRNQKYLSDLTGRLGLNVLETTQAYKLFYAASTQAGLNADVTRKIFTSVSETTSTLKLSQEDTNGVLLAFSQILGKGKVQAEELRGQIGERLPGAFAIAARSIGVTQQQLDKMLQKGELIAADFLPKFAAELQKTFGNSGQVDTLQASVNRLSNSFTDLVKNNESGLSRFFKAVVEGSNDALNGLDLFLSKSADFFQGKLFQPDVVKKSMKKVFENSAEGGLAEIKKLKDANNGLFEDFTNKSSEEQKRLSDIYSRTAQLSSKAYEEAVNKFGRFSDEAQAAGKQLIQDADISERIKKYLAPVGTTQTSDADLKKLSRLRELRLKAIRDSQVRELEEQADFQKSLYENEQNSLNVRIAALDKYDEIRFKIIKVNEDFDKRVADENIIQGQAVEEEKTNIIKKAARDRQKLILESTKTLADINNNAEAKQILAIQNAGQERKDVLENQMLDTQNDLKRLYDSRQITEEQYQILLRQTQNKYQHLQLEDEIDTINKIIEIRKASGEDTVEQEAKIRAIQIQLRKLDLEDFNKVSDEKNKKQEEIDAKRKKAAKELNERLKQLNNELLEATSSIFNSMYEKQKALIDQQLNDNKTRTDKEIESVNRSTASEQEKADKILIINQRSAAEEERLNNRKKQIELQQARFERAKNIASIIGNTASAIVKTFIEYPFVLAAPIAAVIGAIGAAQLATVLSSPLPQYKDGREGGPAEFAIVGDGGRSEVIEHNGQAFITPDKDTLTFLPKNAKVHKSVPDYLRKADNISLKKLPSIDQYKKDRPFKYDDSRLIDAIKNNKATFIVNNSYDGIRSQAITAAGQIEYLNRNVYGK
jgi:tape measure domain-containing protein